MLIEVYNNQSAIVLNETLIERLERAAMAALPLVLEQPAHGGGVLASLDMVEVSLVDDPTIDQVHRDFMDIPGATDVITFAHGEIVLSAETAESYAQEYGNSFEREVMLYIIHGLLHLCGHEDAIECERVAMEKVQFEVLDQVWS